MAHTLIVWASYPMSQKKIVSVLKSFGIKARAFLASVNVAQRSVLVVDFNRSGPDTVHVLVCRYPVVPSGYNLQSNHQVHIVDPPNNEATRTEIIGWTYRIGRNRHVKMVSYMSPDTQQKAACNISRVQNAVLNLATMNQDEFRERYGHPDMKPEVETLPEGQRHGQTV
jgi:hypothetical protein